MRSREEIEAQLSATFSGLAAKRDQVKLVLEVCLDIRDLLQKRGEVVEVIYS